MFFTTTVDDSSSEILLDGFVSDHSLETFNDTLHLSTNPGSTLNFTFNGTSVGVYGGTWPDYGIYSVELDGISKGTYDAYFANLDGYYSTLFLASDLPQGPHHLYIETITGPHGTSFDLDYIVFNSTQPPRSPISAAIASSASTAVVSTVISGSGTATSAPAGSSSRAPNNAALVNPGEIAGAVAGPVVLVACLFALWWFWWRKGSMYHRARTAEHAVDLDPDIVTHMDGAEVEPFNPMNETWNTATGQPELSFHLVRGNPISHIVASIIPDRSPGTALLGSRLPSATSLGSLTTQGALRIHLSPPCQPLSRARNPHQSRYLSLLDLFPTTLHIPDPSRRPEAHRHSRCEG